MTLPEFVFATISAEVAELGGRLYPAGSVPREPVIPYAVQQIIASVGISELSDFEGGSYRGTLQLAIYTLGYSPGYDIARECCLALAAAAVEAPPGSAAFSNFLTTDLGRDPDTGLNAFNIRCDFINSLEG